MRGLASILGILFLMPVTALGNYKWKGASKIFEPVPVKINRTISSSEIEDGCYYMLVDIQLDLIHNQSYYHYAYRIVSENGVQNNSEIEIEYNPSYQKLYLNDIRVYRKGKTIDYKSRSRIKEFQREDALEYHMYDETQTLYLILEDIQVGDIIEYSFTKEGSNPVFDKLVYKEFHYQLPYTLIDYNLRILKPANLELYIKSHHNEIMPERRPSKYGEELIWRIENVPGFKTEDYTPDWYKAYSAIEISSCNNWREIRDWGIRIFNSEEPLDQSIISLCQKIKNENISDEEKIIKALRYVQKNIRYLGVEVGENSHRPHSPNQVFKQGFGDCKDKSLLLVRILNELGFKDAYPALVSTQYMQHVSDYLPSPVIFNHTIVNVKVNNFDYWFDPTITNQAGDLAHYYFMPYGKALVLNGSSDSLDFVGLKAESKINILERFESKNFDSAAFLHVETTYYGNNADDIRFTIQSNSKKQIQESYLEFYRNIYSKIDTLGDLEFSDDTVYNKVTVLENYKINDFWQSDDSLKHNTVRTEISAYDIDNKISVYQKKYRIRRDPLKLENPLHLVHSIILELPTSWSVTPAGENISNDFFEFHYRSWYRKNIISLEYEFLTKKDFVPASQSNNFIRDIQRVKNDMGYQLTYRRGHSVNSPESAIGLASLLSYIILLSMILVSVI